MSIPEIVLPRLDFISETNLTKKAWSRMVRFLGRLNSFYSVPHTNVINWMKAVGQLLLPEAYNPETIPEVGELDEMGTFVGQKNKIWLWIILPRTCL